VAPNFAAYFTACITSSPRCPKRRCPPPLPTDAAAPACCRRRARPPCDAA